MDVAADRNGRTVDVTPAGGKRLLELQAELEKASGPRRVALQQEIDQLGAASPAEGTRTTSGPAPKR
jgi:hypothetical protein